MALKLRVISDHYKALGKRSSQLFGVSGGRIGRAVDNDWILPDPDRYVSSHHARVSFRAGEWLLEDTSTNGVFINGADTPASVEGTYTLKDGDRLRMGEYELIVSIDDRNDFSPDESGQMPAPKRVRNASSTAAPGTSAVARAAAKAAPKLDEDLGEELDITDLLSESLIQAAPPPRAVEPPMTSFELTQALGLDLEPKPAPSAAKPQRSGFASLLETPPADAPARRNDDWQMQTRPYDRRTMTALTSPAALVRPEKTEPERVKRDSPSLDSGSGIEAFCRGAGLDPSTLPADAQTALLTLAGQMVREVVLGLMDTLKGRADLKSRLRLSQTTIQPGENNPLKFSASVDEAVRKLLDPHGSRYLGPIEAIRDSFADLRLHQTALVAAIQAAIDEFMNRIEPRDLQERFDRGLKRGPLLGATNKMKYWELYSEFYQALNQRNEQGLPTVFAEELARTYAERSTPKKK